MRTTKQSNKESRAIVTDSVELSKTMALMVYSLGRTMTMLTINPRQAAALCISASEELSQISDQMLNLSERILKWDESRIIVQGKSLVDVKHNPISSK